MDWTANVAVHESASPAFIREQILSSLKSGRVHPSLLYSGLRQTSLWIALHRAFSPAQQDESCAKMYDDAFDRAAINATGSVLHVVSLACGDGSKDLRALRKIRGAGRIAIYTPTDISLEMVLAALRETASALPGLQVTPLLCDLPRCSVLPAILKSFDPSGAERIILFLGTIHNYWPPEILRSVLYPLRSQDQLLISANLAAAQDYETSLQRILTQYDNRLTREWLMGALSELGLRESDGELRFEIRRSELLPALKRIEVTFECPVPKRITFQEEELEVTRLTVFFSYRFTREQIGSFLQQAGLTISDQFISASGEEGLFLCRRSA